MVQKGMLHKSIAQDIIKTGGVIRDWVAPFYTLGAAVAFAIGMLTLLDEDGTLHLTRIVGAVLLIATFLAWAQHVYQQHKSKEATTGPGPAKAKLHIVLMIITSFFMVGILVSEAAMKGHRKQLQIQNAASEAPAPAPAPAPTPTPAPAPAPAPARIDIEPDTKPLASIPANSSQPVVTTPAPSTPVPPPQSTKTSSSTKDNQELRLPKPRKPQATEAPPTETVAAKAKQPTQDGRCSAVIAAFSLGQDLSPQQQKDLEKCR